jgi:hypothetical protein
MDATAGLDLQEDGDDFILIATDENGTVSRLRLTEDQMLTFAQSAPVVRDKIVLRRSPEEGGVSVVVVTLVSDLGIQPDSLKESVLLTLQSATRGRLTFGLSPNAVRLLLEYLPKSLAEIESANLTRQ